MDLSIFRKVFTHSLIYGVANTTNAMLGFLLIPLYTAVLSPEEYGILSLVLVLQTLLFCIYDFGMTNGYFRIYFDYPPDDVTHQKRVVSTSLCFLTLLGAGLTILFILLSPLLSKILFGTDRYSLIVQIAIFTLFFRSLMMTPFNLLRIREKANQYASVSVARVALAIGLNMVLVYFLRMGVPGVLGSYLTTSIVISLFLILLGRKDYDLQISLPDLKKMLAFGTPFVPVLLSLGIIETTDKYFLGIFTDLETVGIYSLGYTIATGVLFVVTAFSLAWPPLLYSIIEREDAKRIYRLVATYFFLVVAFVTLLFSAFSKEIIEIFILNRSYQEAAGIIPIIALSYLVFALNRVFGAGIGVKKKTLNQPLIVGVAAAANVGFNLILIPIYGMWGAAIATLIAYSVVTFGTLYVSQRIYHIDYEYGRMAKVAMVFFSAYILTTFINFDLGWSILVKSVLVLAAIGIIYLTGFFTSGEIETAKKIVCHKLGIFNK